MDVSLETLPPLPPPPFRKRHTYFESPRLSYIIEAHFQINRHHTFANNFIRQEENLPRNGLIRLYLPIGCTLFTQKVAMCPDVPYFIIFALSYAWLCYSSGRECLNPVHTLQKKLSDNENINLKMPRFLWQGKLPNRASKIKWLLARHEFHLPRASGKVLSYTSACFVYWKTTKNSKF
jgi:hypothetical protein